MRGFGWLHGFYLDQANALYESARYRYNALQDKGYTMADRVPAAVVAEMREANRILNQVHGLFSSYNTIVAAGGIHEMPEGEVLVKAQKLVPQANDAMDRAIRALESTPIKGGGTIGVPQPEPPLGSPGGGAGSPGQPWYKQDPWIYGLIGVGALALFAATMLPTHSPPPSRRAAKRAAKRRR